MENLTRTDSPQIYVTCLAAYNNGILHGFWIDADREPWAIWADIRDRLTRSPIEGAEEHAIHDYEGFGPVRIEEYARIDHVAALAAFIVEHGELGAAILDHYNNDLEEAREALADRYHGCHGSLAAYMQELTEETATIPDALRYYVDYDAMAHDAELNGGFFTVETDAWQVHVFSSN